MIMIVVLLVLEFDFDSQIMRLPNPIWIAALPIIIKTGLTGLFVHLASYKSLVPRVLVMPMALMP